MAANLDPTRTITLREQYYRAIHVRFLRLKTAIKKFVVDDDAFGLSGKSDVVSSVDELVQNSLTRNQTFKFLTDDKKVAAFNRWLADQINKGILELEPGESEQEPWTARYVYSAYRKGVIKSYLESRKKDVSKRLRFTDGTVEDFLRDSFNSPERISKLRLLATRSYEGLKGITSSMSSQMGRIFAQGVAEGRHPYVIARQLNRSIDKIGRNRAKVLARTETIHAHAEGQLDSFEDLGVDEVGIEAEFATAGDDRVCPICASYEGKIYKVSEARGIIPLHPQCRCAWLPVVETGRRRRRKAKAEEARDVVFGPADKVRAGELLSSGARPTIIGALARHLSSATSKTALSRDDLLVRLMTEFPDRDPQKLRKGLSSQLTRLKRQGHNVVATDEGYYIAKPAKRRAKTAKRQPPKKSMVSELLSSTLTDSLKTGKRTLASIVADSKTRRSSLKPAFVSSIVPRPSLLDTIVAILRVATTGLTKTEIAERLLSVFPDRDPDRLSKDIPSQLSRIKRERRLPITRVGDRYYLRTR